MTSFLLRHSFLPLLPCTTESPSRKRYSSIVRSVAGPPREESIVIVGAGIGGLATAVSLKRLGIEAVVIEQGESLRTTGTSLGVFKNGWRVLDSIGVGDELRTQFAKLKGLCFRSEDGKELASMSIEGIPGQEIRPVERRVLLETLAKKLPPDTIRFSSGMKSIQQNGNGKLLLDLDDGTQLLAKIVIGADGVRSRVAKWMGFPEPRYVGQCAFRGVAIYPEGQPFGQKLSNFYGRGLRIGCIPVSATKLYWFVVYNASSPGPKIQDPIALKKVALELIRNCPADIQAIVEKTPDESILKTRLVDRWLWPVVSPSGSSGGAVVIGDAWHPMTPNLGQGACSTLEDAISLALKIGEAIGGDPQNINRALVEYSKERWSRVSYLTVRSYLVGSFLQWENPLICGIRDRIIIPKFLNLDQFLSHTNFECPLLPESSIQNPK
ncbi:Monooxygenase, FAD-binding protein [Zostera marina]|uniref:Monooxygenase, FAD-binding protein n=1 Tax=Zostera marina TaxID=29655 RepID=A0A0K9NZJ1_ZOSMR|nr:Monooxygenase, FAD-binding protein [Zostera marina]